MRVFGNRRKKLRMLRKVLAFEEGAHGLATLRIIECSGQQLPIQQAQKRIGEGAVILAVQRRRLLQQLRCCDVRPLLAIARSGEQHDVLVWIRRRRRPRGGHRGNLGDTQIPGRQREVAGMAEGLPE